MHRANNLTRIDRIEPREKEQRQIQLGRDEIGREHETESGCKLPTTYLLRDIHLFLDIIHHVVHLVHVQVPPGLLHLLRPPAHVREYAHVRVGPL